MVLGGTMHAHNDLIEVHRMILWSTAGKHCTFGGIMSFLGTLKICF